MTAWQFMNVLAYKFPEDAESGKIKGLQDLYDFLTPELEKLIEARPSHPQMYHVLATTYRLGFEKLGRNDLDKAEAVLRKGFQYSDLRAEYQNEFAEVLFLQGKFEEAEQAVRSYAERAPREWGAYFPSLTLGHFYFSVEKQEEAFDQYEKAREAGHKFFEDEIEYNRYLLVAEKAKRYDKVVDMAKEWLAYNGPDADTYFNIAVGYFHLGEKEAAKEAFLKAVELSPEYEEYRPIFE